jgi:hypothetical protein
VQDLSFNRLKIGKFSPFQRTLAISQGIDSLVGQWEACKIAAEPTAHTSKTAMNVLRRRINPKTFVITNTIDNLPSISKLIQRGFGVGKNGRTYFGCILKV